ncbi:MAG: hypothetical protein NZM25_10680 [Leptospiraceae bacterium]|nr:hypothetical protein [Leptospiraceae bacterium]MDW8305893.1 hypothetical protein [Leptospiraceae bacterium]
MYLHIFDSPAKDAGLNLAFEEYLLRFFPKEPQHGYLFFYESNKAIILGQSLKLEQEVFLHKHIPPIYRRLSGGGSVCHFPGNLNFAFFVNYECYPYFYPIKKSYDKILGAISQNIPGVVPMGISDLCLFTSQGYGKLSGNSQARKKGWLMHHGTFIYRKDFLNTIRFYLRLPPKQPAYRQNRSHELFLSLVLPIKSRALLKNSLIKALSELLQLKPRLHDWSSKKMVEKLRQFQLPIPRVYDLSTR